MNKLLQGVAVVIIGAIAMGALASAFYVFMSFDPDNSAYVRYYGDNPIQAWAIFMFNPYEGQSISSDDLYIRNVIFGISALIMGASVYRKL